MTNVLGLVLLGLFLGMRHATDPDHVIAVTTIVSRHRTPAGAAAIGAAWGLGHTLTIFVVGGCIIVFGWVVPPRLGLSTELSVGVMLIGLGLVTLTGAVRGAMAAASIDPGSGAPQRDTPAQVPARPQPHGDAQGHAQGHAHADPPARGHSHGHSHGQSYMPSRVHSHPHSHGDYIHTHAHGHDPEVHPHADDATPVGWLDRHLGALRGYRLVRPLLVGIVHGLAGSAAVALLVLATIGSPTWGMLYLLVFGLGTILGMTLMTTAIVLPFAYSQHRFTRLNDGLRIASGLISIAFGLFVAYQIGIVDGLFTGHPRWTPR